MSQKILFICLSSYYAPNLGGYDPKSFYRQEVYAIALHRLLEIASQETRLIIVDNTVETLEKISLSLKKLFNNEKIKDVILVNNNNFGSKNRGAGEYVMCRAVLEKYHNYLKDFDWIVYYTSRYPISFSLIFDYIEKYSNKQAIVANASYLYADGKKILSAPGNFNDVIFAMKPNNFIEYINSMDPGKLVKLKMNSETNLYNYIHERNLDFEEVYRWGVLRYNYTWHKSEII